MVWTSRGRNAWLFGAAVVAQGLLGCSDGSGDSGSVGGDGGSDSGTDPDPPQPGTGGSTSSAPGSEKAGGITFIDNVFALGGTSFMQISFREERLPSNCTPLHEEGGCRVSRCLPSGAAPPERRPHAGTVTYEGTDIPGTLSSEPDAQGSYSPTVDTREGHFLDLTPAVFRATGGDVPAFEEPLDFPLRLVLSSPPTTGGHLYASRDEALELRWSRGEPGGILDLQGSSDDGEAAVALFCSFPAESGQGTIASRILQEVLPETLIMLVGLNTKTIEAGEFEVTLRAGDLVADAAMANAVWLHVE